MVHLAGYGGMRLIIGYHNTEPSESPMAGWLIGEDHFYIPETKQEMREPPRQNGKTHSDYAIVIALLQFGSRRMVRTTSDHNCAYYDVAWKNWDDLYMRPKAVELTGDRCDSDQWQKICAKHEDAYNNAVETNAAEAWISVSRTAEEASCAQTEGKSKGHERHEIPEVKPKDKTHHASQWTQSAL